MPSSACYPIILVLVIILDLRMPLQRVIGNGSPVKVYPIQIGIRVSLIAGEAMKTRECITLVLPVSGTICRGGFFILF